MSQEDIRQAFSNMEARMQEVQAALVGEQDKTANLERKFRNEGSGTTDTTGLIGAIRKGQMRDVVPKKFNNIQASGGF